MSAWRRDDLSANPSGAVFVWAYSAANGWKLQGDLDVFGIGFSPGTIGLSGDSLVASSCCSASVFVRTGSSWAKQGNDIVWAGTSDVYGPGASVAIDGDTIALGPRFNSVTAAPQGSVYVFVRSGTTWTAQGAALRAADGKEGDGFGTSVALQGDTLVVGAPAQTVGSNVSQGAAYVFARSQGIWRQQGPPLVAPDGRAQDRFGQSVALSGDRLLAGAPVHALDASNTGAVYAFQRDGSTWSTPTVLTAPGGEQSFGWQVAIDGATALVGDPGYALPSWFEYDAPNTYYKEGAAFPFVFLGGACGVSTDCLSGSCSDGMCCNQACSGSCDVCAKSAGASEDGQCTVLPAGSAGDPACSPKGLACTGKAECEPASPTPTARSNATAREGAANRGCRSA